MKKKLLNNEEKIKIPDSIFGVEMNNKLLYQVVTSMQKTRKKSGAHAKTRKEVAGGGRKPWPQKGTGRARHGSIRSPLWKGGGVTFGPSKKEKFKKKINKKMKRKALFMVLSQKLQDEEIKFVKDINLTKPKTKLAKKKLRKIIPDKTSSGLILISNEEKKIKRACNNLPDFDTMPAKDINPLDLLRYRFLIIPEKALKIIKETFNKQ